MHRQQLELLLTDDLLLQGHWGKEDAAGQAQVLTLHIIRAIKLPPNQKRERTTGKKVKGSWPWTHKINALGYIPHYSVITSVLAG